MFFFVVEETKTVVVMKAFRSYTCTWYNDGWMWERDNQLQKNKYT